MSHPAVRCRTISQHLNDLKKENFSLKLRIYFLEEKIQRRFEQSRDDVHKKVRPFCLFRCSSSLRAHVPQLLCVCQCVTNVQTQLHVHVLAAKSQKWRS